jgi:coniferyl-aldehyde dehydrogenase
MATSLSAPSTPSPSPGPSRLEALLHAQRAAFQAQGEVTATVRRERLGRAIDLLVTHQAALCEAVASDFGQRPAGLTGFMDIFPAVHALKFARRNVARWMRPERPRLGFPNILPGMRAEIVYQPLGVVGVISPWNFPVTLAFGPLAGILAAGNRCMLKPSELTPATSALLGDLIARAFAPEEIAVINGGPDVAMAFSRLPFDHLVFTGSTPIGRQVMAAAAEHLVPVTLELGGKCPAVVGRSAPLARAVDRILLGKLANAGQICLAPDYVYVPRENVGAFVEEAKAWAGRVYPGLPGNRDYTALVSARHRQRAEELIADARAQGADIVGLGEGGAGALNVLAPALILGVTDAMQVMREEIFAPLLPVLGYDRIESVIAGIQQRARPLALYYFGSDKVEQKEILARTVSGGVTVNDVAMHFLAEELPFGGIGPSGMGAYHGEHGFRRFSHARAVFHQSRFDLAGLTGLRPPYGKRLRRSLSFLIRR